MALQLRRLAWPAYVAMLTLPVLYGLALGIREQATLTAEVTQLAKAYGWATVVAVVLGLRTSLRGGGLVLPAESLHALLAPIPRERILRPALLRLLVAAFGLGGLAGLVVSYAVVTPRSGHLATWLSQNFVLGGVTGLVFAIAASLPSATPLARLISKSCIAATIAWTVFDLAVDRTTFPISLVSRLLFAPDSQSAWAVAGLTLVFVAALYALWVAPSSDLESGAARANRSAAIRLGVLMGDLGPAMLLRHDLVGEQPRSSPWISISTRAPFAGRHLRSYMRWPLGRIARLVSIATLSAWVIALQLRGHWALVPVAALLLWLGTVELGEPLLQHIVVARRNDSAMPHREVSIRLATALTVAIALPVALAIGAPLLVGGEEAMWWLVPLVVAGAVAAVIATVLPSPVDLFDTLVALGPGVYFALLTARLTVPLLPLILALAPSMRAGWTVQLETGDLLLPLSTVFIPLAVFSILLAVVGWLSAYGSRSVT